MKLVGFSAQTLTRLKFSCATRLGKGLLLGSKLERDLKLQFSVSYKPEAALFCAGTHASKPAKEKETEKEKKSQEYRCYNLT